MKKSYLYIFITVVFLASFYHINTKFDRFYRVQGINNENRLLIEQYLDEEAQDYIIENRIAVNEFIDYIKSKSFNIENIDYYNLLKDSKHYSSNKSIVKYGNKLKEKATEQFNGSAYDEVVKLVDASLEKAYVNNDDFDFDQWDFYVLLKDVYKKSYVKKTISIKESLAAQGLDNDEDQLAFLTTALKKYTTTAFKKLMNEDKKVRLIADPTDLTVVVDQNSSISSYEPKNITLLEEVKRYKYAMYATDDTYKALVKMMKAMGSDSDNLVIADAYISYDEATMTDKKLAGHQEQQLGTTLVFTRYQHSYYQFHELKMSEWLQKNAYKYGFILRYPEKKASLTNHDYDAHVYRYVGTDIAKVMHERNWCLEEYNRSAVNGGE